MQRCDRCAFQPFSCLNKATIPLIAQQGTFEGRRLLVTGNKRSALNTAKTCMAEDMCVAKACGKAYEQTASNFPFSIDYQKSTTSDATTFDFQVTVMSQTVTKAAHFSAVHTCA